MTVTKRNESVNCTHADVEMVVNARACQRRWWRCLQGIFFRRENRTFAVNRIAEPVEHASEEFGTDLHTQTTPRRNDLAAGTYALHLTDRHEEYASLTEAHHLGRYGRHAGEVRAHITELPNRDRRSLRLDDESDDLRHLARQLHRRSLMKCILKFLDIYGKWGISPRFTHIHSITSRTAFFSCSICV